jgi:hypothetical protein
MFVSDLSGKEIPEGRAAQISIKFTGTRKGTYVLDVTEEAGLPSSIGVPARTGGASIGRLAVSSSEAAASIGVSLDFFDEHVRPELRVVWRGRRVLVPIRELERWLDREASRALTG